MYIRTDKFWLKSQSKSIRPLHNPYDLQIFTKISSDISLSEPRTKFALYLLDFGRPHQRWHKVSPRRVRSWSGPHGQFPLNACTPEGFIQKKWAQLDPRKKSNFVEKIPMFSHVDSPSWNIGEKERIWGKFPDMKVLQGSVGIAWKLTAG